MKKSKTHKKAIVPLEIIERRIFLIRGFKVMLDNHLAELYEVPTFRLNEAVKRNRGRFPKDFMFRLTKEEVGVLTSQFAISKSGSGGRRTLPYVFTEQGVAMLSTVLNGDRAIAVNIAIMRTFVQLRKILSTNKELAEKLKGLESKYDKKFRIVFDVLRQLLQPLPEPPKRPMGFQGR
jgi:hypothetical protein